MSCDFQDLGRNGFPIRNSDGEQQYNNYPLYPVNLDGSVVWRSASGTHLPTN